MQSRAHETAVAGPCRTVPGCAGLRGGHRTPPSRRAAKGSGLPRGGAEGHGRPPSRARSSHASLSFLSKTKPLEPQPCGHARVQAHAHTARAPPPARGIGCARKLPLVVGGARPRSENGSSVVQSDRPTRRPLQPRPGRSPPLPEARGVTADGRERGAQASPPRSRRVAGAAATTFHIFREHLPALATKGQKRRLIDAPTVKSGRAPGPRKMVPREENRLASFF